jgi:cyclopropane fatty-acyl-phospholipid synthase-like methyltransferase
MKLACKNKMPECLVLSDVDEGSLSLCRQNCEQNLSACKERIKIQHLSWGDCADVEECFDTIIATDVIYDVSAIRPLFSTVKRYLAPFGYFILSHVPRASLSDDSCKIAPQDKMEKFIEREANSHGLNLNEVVRPENIAFSHQEITRMKEAGAAIMVFRTEEPAETAIFPWTKYEVVSRKLLS